jgi:hypothetical protein
MVSNVKYPRWPAAGLGSARRLVGLAIYLLVLAGGLLVPEYFLFPLGLTYVTYGLARALWVGLSERNDDDGDDDPTLIRPAGHLEETSA